MDDVVTPYRVIETEVEDVIVETPTIKTLVLRPREELRFAPGQFIDVTVPGVGEAPFTPSSHFAEPQHIKVTIMRVGRVTQEIHRLKAGDVVGVRGPLGNGYPLDRFVDKEVLVVGGGCGFAPLRSLMYALFDWRDRLRKLFFRGGCRSLPELVYRDELRQWSDRPDLDMALTLDRSDAEWKGPVGVVTTLLEGLHIDTANAVAVICGPPVMMRFCTLHVLRMGFRESDIFLSMERNMSCGLGKCGHCRLGTFYCCKDGPVFTYDRIKKFPDLWN